MIVAYLRNNFHNRVGKSCRPVKYLKQMGETLENNKTTFKTHFRSTWPNSEEGTPFIKPIDMRDKCLTHYFLSHLNTETDVKKLQCDCRVNRE